MKGCCDAKVFAALLLFFQYCWAQPPLNTSLHNYATIYKPVDYAVIGQQKSGTSSLWQNLGTHPRLKWVGTNQAKETFFFKGELAKHTMCDAHIEDYQRHVAMQRLMIAQRVAAAGGSAAAADEAAAGVLIGDWTATHFSCICCPMVFRTLNPSIKLIVVLRDPVKRVVSRFLEQKRGRHLPFYNLVVNHTFASYVQADLDELEGCLRRAAALGPSRPAGDASFVGWGAGMGLVGWMEAQCYSRNNILGWSVYDVFLENYFAHFPKEQILVLYTDDLAKRPLETFRAVESFLGVQHHTYDQTRSAMFFNSRECYRWNCGKQAGDIRPMAVVGGGDGLGQEAEFSAATARLAAFYRPHVQRLFKWADEGRIAQPPPKWREAYA